MSTANTTPKSCYKCSKGSAAVTCDGCRQSFCVNHLTVHRQELSQQMDDIGQQNDTLRRNSSKHGINKTLLDQINQWEKESIAKIQRTADTARADLKSLTEEAKNRLTDSMNELSNELRLKRDKDDCTENDLDRWKSKLEELRKKLETPLETKLLEDESSYLQLIKIKSPEKSERNKTNSSLQNVVRSEEKPSKAVAPRTLSQNGDDATNKSELSTKISPFSPSQSSLYPSITFGLNQTSNQATQGLFESLMLLLPMDKNGPMNGKCGPETDQMERFLLETFDFKNISGQHIVQGVKDFKLRRPPRDMDPNKMIHFPYAAANSFAMTVREVMDWQRSYAVYADKNMQGMNTEFLRRALQGQSKDGEEAFRMKFVVRISTCPILMEFDAKIISRKMDEKWPHNIKLVSVTGIDFAGRKHDVGDIFQYLLNWKEIYEIDSRTNAPLLCNERDFQLRVNRQRGVLHEERLFRDLMCMARLRLRACDEQGVQVVVETGIGLGVFAGSHIGIDEKVQIISALAIRAVLEEDGPNYKNIRGAVFALPIIDENKRSKRIHDSFSDFVHGFQEPQYNGPIPVLIADQDMHRLTVHIARQGFVVSQLNPADSHGVFGEYWQNRGPAVEEKLALTTVGLLVQHHLINPYVLNPDNYHLI